MIADIANSVIDGLVTAVNAIASILPDSPFKSVIETVVSSVGSDMLGYINYFLPISEMVSILSAWVVAIMIYYVYSIILRWAKAIS